MFTIKKSFSISASHALDHLPSAHPCHNLHGHNYKVTVELSKSTDRPDDLENGFVLDYRALDKAKEKIMRLDHAHLNDVILTFIHNSLLTTSEHLAFGLFHELKPFYPNLSAIEISETDNTFARYSPSLEEPVNDLPKITKKGPSYPVYIKENDDDTYIIADMVAAYMRIKTSDPKTVAHIVQTASINVRTTLFEYFLEVHSIEIIECGIKSI